MGLKAMLQMYRLLLAKPEVRAKYRAMRGSVAKALTLVFVVEALSVAEVYPLRGIFDGMTVKAPASTLVIWVFAMFGIRQVHTVLDQHKEYHQMVTDWNNLGNILGHGHEHQLSQDQKYQIDHSTGEKESTLSKNIWKMENLIDVVIYQVTPMIIMIGFILVALAIFDWRYSAITAVTIAIYCLVTRHFEKAFAPKREEEHKEWKAIEQMASEQVKGWRTIKSNGLELQKARELQSAIEKFMLANAKRRRIRIRHWVVQNSVLSVSILFIWGFSLWLYSINAMSTGVLVIINGWIAKLYSHMFRYANFQREAYEGVASLNDVVELLSSSSAIDGKPNALRMPISGLGYEVVLDGVGFRYHDDGEYALRDITAKLPAGSTVAIMAPSGGGKSTLADLLIRAYDTCEGTIYLDGIDLRDIDRQHLMQVNAATVLQDANLFDGSIASNIGFGCLRELSQGEVEIAAKQAFAHEFIMEFPEGYDTIVGEDGVRLSGGERQRIAIARALAKQPQLLIMDEATSALDEPSQQMVNLSVQAKSAERRCTIVLIAHRFSTVAHADYVLVLDHGELVDFGTIPELEKRCELFRRLRSGEISME